MTTNLPRRPISPAIGNVDATGILHVWATPQCPFCHGSGQVIDWVPLPFGSGNTAMPSECEACIESAIDLLTDEELRGWDKEGVSLYLSEDGPRHFGLNVRQWMYLKTAMAPLYQMEQNDFENTLHRLAPLLWTLVDALGRWTPVTDVSHETMEAESE